MILIVQFLYSICCFQDAFPCLWNGCYQSLICQEVWMYIVFILEFCKCQESYIVIDRCNGQVLDPFYPLLHPVFLAEICFQKPWSSLEVFIDSEQNYLFKQQFLVDGLGGHLKYQQVKIQPLQVCIILQQQFVHGISVIGSLSCC